MCYKDFISDYCWFLFIMNVDHTRINSSISVQKGRQVILPDYKN